MENFFYHVPTDIYFGKGQIEHLGARMAQLGKKVLLVYGGGSIKRIGLYDAVTAQLEGAGVEYVELPGVEPNPRIQSVRAGVALCRENDLTAVLAVGGGSTIDCAKMVAAGVCYEGDPWDLVLDRRKITAALPIAAVLTNAATGSEMDGFAVISDMEKNEKWGSGNDHTKPVFSILDPTYSMSLPAYQTASGASDIMSHTFENYFNRTKGAYLQSRLAEGVLKTCIHYAPIALKKPDDYEARANLMWASSLAINGLLSCGESTSWSVHAIEHELSAFYDITHGAGRALRDRRGDHARGLGVEREHGGLDLHARRDAEHRHALADGLADVAGRAVAACKEQKFDGGCGDILRRSHRVERRRLIVRLCMNHCVGESQLPAQALAHVAGGGIDHDLLAVGHQQAHGALCLAVRFGHGALFARRGQHGLPVGALEGDLTAHARDGIDDKAELDLRRGHSASCRRARSRTARANP